MLNLSFTIMINSYLHNLNHKLLIIAALLMVLFSISNTSKSTGQPALVDKPDYSQHPERHQKKQQSTEKTPHLDFSITGNTMEVSLLIRGNDGEEIVSAGISGSTECKGDVIFKASVQAPNSGDVKIEYPAGNTLSSFPGSLPIKVIYKNIPEGNYTLTIEANNPNGFPVEEDQLTLSTFVVTYWTGAVSTSWFNGSNWSTGLVPTQNDDVIIPSGTPYQPVIADGQYPYSRSLYIQSGATLTQYGQSIFSVYGDFNSDQGTFTQVSQAFIYFRGNTNNSWDDDNEDDTYQYVIIEKGTSNYLAMWQDMTVEQYFLIKEGNFQIDATWELTVTGSSSSAFRVESGGKLTLTDESINIVNGDCTFQDGSQANVGGGTINCGGDFTIDNNTSYNIQFNGGELIMNGSGTQSIEMEDAGSYIFNIITDKPSGTCILNSAALQVNNDFTINNGTFDANDNDIYLWDDWTNNVGPDGFIEGTGRVSFYGPGSNTQHIYSNEQFNILENHTYSAINIDGDLTVECNSYDWTTGGLNIFQGTFIAYDLTDNGIYGDYTVTSGGEIYLSQISSQTVSLRGNNISITDNSLFKITSASTTYGSGWCINGPLNLEINTGGVFDFDCLGITIQDYYALTTSISDGTIKTTGRFNCHTNEFNPTGGTFEFYDAGSSSTKHIDMFAGSSFHNLLINKSDAYNEVELSSDIVVTNDLTIANGVLNSNGFDIYVGDDWTNMVGLDGFIESTGRVVFNNPGSLIPHIYSNEKFNILENNTGSYLNMDTVTVECDQYDWTSGGISVDFGTFTAYDLLDNGIYGNLTAKNGGEIYLNQDNFQYVYLYSQTINIFTNSLIKVTGGYNMSYWCHSNPLNLHIYPGGVFDFLGPGIQLSDNQALSTLFFPTSSIRTSGWFYCFRDDFNPTDGAIELYEGGNSVIFLDSESSFHDLLINKTTSAYLTSDIAISNNLTITSGVLNSSSNWGILIFM
ncbi:MAG: hypothetical protein R2750_10475 [Bacteroidales bacterium]